MSIQTINPATGKPIQTYPTMELPEINSILEKSHHDFLSWRETSFKERAMKMQKVTDILLNKKQIFAELMTQEMGKPITLALAEIEKCIWGCQYFAEHAEHYLQPRHIKTEMKKSYVIYQPTGLIFAIMPWNFPFWQVFRFAVPALMLGNGCILKHAPATTGCGLMIEKIFREAGFPEHIFRTCIIETTLAESIIAHPHVSGVTLTGSVRAGKTVAELAGRHLKKTVLELGGSDPYLVLHDADLELAAEQCVTSRLSNAGQVCIAAKRMIIVDTVRDAFEKLIIEKAKRYQWGDPLRPATNLGPMARADLRDTVHHQVMTCIEKGAELVMGGKIPDNAGYFYPVTLLKNIKPGMPAYDDEIFGPVIALLSAKNEDEAITIANQTSYGLSASIFTKDISRGEKIAEKINVGNCAINGLVASDPRLPFGGTKNSGFGRELGEEGMREFANIKTICLKG